MAQDRFAKTISVIKWIRTSRLSIKNSLSLCRGSEVGPYSRLMDFWVSLNSRLESNKEKKKNRYSHAQHRLLEA